MAELNEECRVFLKFAEEKLGLTNVNRYQCMILQYDRSDSKENEEAEEEPLTEDKVREILDDALSGARDQGSNVSSEILQQHPYLAKFLENIKAKLEENDASLKLTRENTYENHQTILERQQSLTESIIIVKGQQEKLEDKVHTNHLGLKTHFSDG